MFPLQMAGIALAGKTLLSKYKSYTPKDRSKKRFKIHPDSKLESEKRITLANPLQTLGRGLTSAFSQVAKKNAVEDYYTVIRSFVPNSAELLKPKYPMNSREYLFTDIDGDSQKELITSFRQNDDIKTIVLKKRNESWHKIAEINSPEHNMLNYRGTADITGGGKKQLLLGLASKEKTPVIYGYSLENGSINKLFARNYHRFDVLRPAKNNNAAAKAQLAVWSRKDANTYDIDLLHWNGSQLEPSKNAAPYYFNNVIPYYAQKVRQTPYDPAGWLNISEALVKAGLYREAQAAIKVGMGYDRSSSLQEKFMKLKNEISNSL